MSHVAMGMLTFLLHILLFDLSLIENFDGHLVLCKDMLCNLHLHAAKQMSKGLWLHCPVQKVSARRVRQECKD